jgi:hypothetical protein
MALPVAAGLILGAIGYGLVFRRTSVPAGVSAAVPARRTAKPAPTVAANTPAPRQAEAPAPPAQAAIERPSPFLPAVKPPAKPATPPARPSPALQVPPNPAGSASRTETAPAATLVIPRREPAPAVAAALPPPPELAPIATPVRIEQPRHTTRHATVTIEPVTSSKLGRVVGKIPGIGRLGKKTKGFIPARPIRQITPSVPANEDLARDVPVDVKVTVDPAGNVSSVDPHGGDKELARLAADAARNWQFVPARRNDETVSSELILHFTFKSASARP